MRIFRQRQADALLGFFVEELWPVVYSMAVTVTVVQVQERLHMRVMEVDLEVYEKEFGYWKRYDAARDAGK
jgi:hypothetical protein